MFRSTITIVAQTLTFSTVDEYRQAIKPSFNYDAYIARTASYVSDSKQINRTFTLVNNNTLVLTIDWDNEESFNEFYIMTDEEINADITPEFVRTVVTETI